MNFNEVLNDMITAASQENKEIILLSEINGLKQIITQPTRTTMTTSSLIDIVLTTYVGNILQSFVCKSGLTDHNIIKVIRKMNCTKYAPRKLFARNYKQYSVSSHKNELRGQNWDSGTRNNDFNTAWNAFKTIIANIINKHAPLVERTVRSRDCPWLTREIKQKMYQRDYTNFERQNEQKILKIGVIIED